MGSGDQRPLDGGVRPCSRTWCPVEPSILSYPRQARPSAHVGGMLSPSVSSGALDRVSGMVLYFPFLFSTVKVNSCSRRTNFDILRLVFSHLSVLYTSNWLT